MRDRTVFLQHGRQLFAPQVVNEHVSSLAQIVDALGQVFSADGTSHSRSQGRQLGHLKKTSRSKSTVPSGTNFLGRLAM
jgi:hypothetical protein